MSVKPTETLNLSNQYGDMIVGTANVPAKGMYLTIVLRNQMPFDMALSETVEDALAAHKEFCTAAELFGSLLATINDMDRGNIH